MNQVAEVGDGRVRRNEDDSFDIEYAKQEWESAVDLLPQVICLLDANGRILRINRTADTWNLGKVQAARGLTVHQLLHPRCTDSDCALHDFWPRARAHLQSGGPTAYRVEDTTQNRQVEIVTRSFRQPAGHLRLRRRVYAVAMIGDVSRVKKTEARLHGQCDELRRQLEAGRTQLSQIRERLSEMSAQLLEVQETERARITSKLHDSIGPSLSVIRLELENARRGKSGKTKEMLELLSSKVKSAIDEVRQLSTELRPGMLDDLGILPTINWFVREFCATYPDITVDREVSVGEADVPERLKIVIFRVLQEALHAIARQDGKMSICIRLGLFGRTLELAIEESGPSGGERRSPDDSEAGVGPGTISLRERVRFSGGDCQMLSWPGHGTLTRVRWPLG